MIEFVEPRVGKLDVPVEEVGEHPIRFFDSDGTSRSDQHSAIHEEHTICRSRTLKAVSYLNDGDSGNLLSQIATY